MRKGDVAKLIRLEREAAELEQPHADSIAVVVALEPAQHAQLLGQSMHRRLGQMDALAEIHERQHLVAVVERVHDHRDPAQHRAPGLARIVTVRDEQIGVDTFVRLIENQ